MSIGNSLVYGLTVDCTEEYKHSFEGFKSDNIRGFSILRYLIQI
jgi:hypothetical protein